LATQSRWVLSVLRNTVRALDPFSLQRRRLGRDVVTRRFLEAQSVDERNDFIWSILQGSVEGVRFRREGLIWNGSISNTVTRALFFQGGYHSEELRSLVRSLARLSPSWSSRSLIVNVGANIGDTCIPLARETGKRVIACEPVPQTYEFLCRNVTENGLEKLVRCRQLAISAKAGPVTMLLAEDPSHNEIRGEDGCQGYSIDHYRAGSMNVPASSLDAIVSDDGGSPESVALVWSDTQGFESDVLESGRALWAAGAPAWVELWPDGLAAHGGTQRFVDVCRRHFRHFLASRSILRGDLPPSEIVHLPRLVDSLPKGGFTDVLLLP
jgi:FkbM family methyltransferase